MKLSVRSKLILWYVGTICILIAAFFTYTYFNFSHAIYGSDVIVKFDDGLLRFGRDVLGRISAGYGPFYTPIGRYREEFDSWIGRDLFLSPAYGQLIDFPERQGAEPLVVIRNRALGDRQIPLTVQSYMRLREGEYAIETVQGVFAFPLRVISMKARDRLGHEYLLQVGMSMEHINTTLVSVLVQFLLIGPFLILIIALMGYFFVERAFAPVRELVTMTRTITAEDLSRRIESIDSDDEIGKLAATLNDMISRLEQSFNQVRQFSDDVSHELKTPLTVLKGEIEVALRGKREAAEYIEILKSLLEETDKLGRIIDDLLFLSRIDSRGGSIRFRDTELDQVVMQAYEEALVLAHDKKVNLQISALDEVTVSGEPGLLKRIFSNLIHNAIKYTPEGGVIDLALRRAGQEGDRMAAEFTVRDTGIGIPARHIPHVFDRFYRVDRSRTAKTGGTGLGLTIVKKILDLHHGTVRLESQKGKGTVFFLRFPKN